MRWKDRRQSSNVEDRRSTGRKVAAGGGLGFLGLAVVVALIGGDPTYFLSEGLNRTIQSQFSRSNLSEEEQDELADFVSVVLAETEETWETRFQAEGQRYPAPTLVLFTGSAESACGYASAAVGPFYCPLDAKLYIDLDFFYELKNRHDAPGDFAQAYVIAHEVGHHVQNVLGVLDQADAARNRAGRTGGNEISVQVELMADCLAGIWAGDVREKDLLEEGDIEEALNAASQIGDDTLQEQAQGYVVPDSFTHGSSAQRYAAFKKGFEHQSLSACGVS